MKKKLVLSIVLVGLLAFGAGLGTFAWFTSTDSSDGNVFATGTLELTATEDGAGKLEFDNAQPGDSVERTLTIDNAGSLALRYKLIPTLTATDSELEDDLVLIIMNGTTQIFNDTLDQLLAEYEINPNMLSGGSETLTFTLILPTTAGNDCQGKSATVNFEFRATQTDNNTYQGTY